MNINMLIWIVIVVIGKHQAEEIFPKIRFISSGPFQIFVPIKSVYSLISEKECKKLNGSYICTYEIPEQIQRNLTKLIKINNVAKFICQFHGTVILNENIIKVLDKKMCLYDKGYCYDNDKSVMFWDTSRMFESLFLFEGELDLWEMELFSHPITLFSHNTINLTLVINQAFTVNDETLYSTSIDDVYVRSSYSGVSDYFESCSEKYFGKLSNKTGNYGDEIENVAKAQVVASGPFLEIFPIKTLYYLVTVEDCRILNGEYIRTTNIAPNVQTLMKKITKSIPLSICQFQATVLLNKNIIFLIDSKEPCRYDKGYCYNNNKTLVVWDTASIFSSIYYKDDMKIWQIENTKLNFQLKLFSTKSNVPSCVIQRVMEENGRILLTSSVNDYVIYVPEIPDVRHFTKFPEFVPMRMVEIEAMEENSVMEYRMDMVYLFFVVILALTVVIDCIGLLSICMNKKIFFS